MKKVYLLLFTFLMGMSVNAQMMQGSFSIDPYVGVPNWANSLLYNQYNGDEENIQEYRAVGSMLSYGGRFEYMLSDKVGVGADVNYEVSGFAFKFEDQVYAPDGSGLGGLTTYEAQYTAKKLRAMLRLNYHFVQSEKVDMYSAFAGGYKNVNRTWETNPSHPEYQDANASGAIIPVTLRIAVGAKVYFTQNIGAHIELGAFGGGLLQAGLSVKF